MIEFIHAKNKDVSLAHTLRLNDPDDYTYTTFSEALEEARGLIDEAEGDTDDVHLPLGEEFPVELHFEIAEGNGEDTYMLAPRIQSD